MNFYTTKNIIDDFVSSEIFSHSLKNFNSCQDIDNLKSIDNKFQKHFFDNIRKIDQTSDEILTINFTDSKGYIFLSYEINPKERKFINNTPEINLFAFKGYKTQDSFKARDLVNKVLKDKISGEWNTIKNDDTIFATRYNSGNGSTSVSSQNLSSGSTMDFIYGFNGLNSSSGNQIILSGSSFHGLVYFIDANNTNIFYTATFSPLPNAYYVSNCTVDVPYDNSGNKLTGKYYVQLQWLYNSDSSSLYSKYPYVNLV